MGYLIRAVEDSNSVTCGICGKEIEYTMIEHAMISDWDIKKMGKRDHAFICCGRSWLINIDDGKAVDCGSASGLRLI